MKVDYDKLISDVIIKSHLKELRDGEKHEDICVHIDKKLGIASDVLIKDGLDTAESYSFDIRHPNNYDDKIDGWSFSTPKISEETFNEIKNKLNI